MAEVLVLVKVAGGAVSKPTLEALTLARGLGEPAAVVVEAPGTAQALVERLGEYGATKVYVAESAEATTYLVTPKAAVLETLVRQASPAAVLIPSTQEGREVAARLDHPRRDHLAPSLGLRVNMPSMRSVTRKPPTMLIIPKAIAIVPIRSSRMLSE